MEVRTELLDETRLEDQLHLLCELCQQFAPEDLEVSYGWACNLAIDALWKPHRIPSIELIPFVERALSQGVVELGASDLHVAGPKPPFSFTLCHESDIHFESDDPGLIRRVADAWKYAGLQYYEVG